MLDFIKIKLFIINFLHELLSLQELPDSKASLTK